MARSVLAGLGGIELGLARPCLVRLDRALLHGDHLAEVLGLGGLARLGQASGFALVVDLRPAEPGDLGVVVLDLHVDRRGVLLGGELGAGGSVAGDPELGELPLVVVVESRAQLLGPGLELVDAPLEVA
jgi:hypothetical protein